MRGPVVLHLLRHGQSTWNAAGLLQGCTPDVGLTARGRAQARAAAALLATRPVGAVLASDQRRALLTAVPVAAAHGLGVVAVAALREQCHGSWEGLPVAGRAERLAAAGPGWAPPGGESAAALRARVACFLDDLLADPPPGEIVLVSHGETIRALAGAGHGPPANGAVLTIEVGEPAVASVRSA